jgi:hypothetical protein
VKSIGGETIPKIKLGMDIDAAVHGLELIPDHARSYVVTDGHEVLCDSIETTIDDAKCTSILDPPRGGSLSLGIGG